MTIVPVAFDISPLVNKQVDGFWGTAVNQHIALNLKGIDNIIMTRNEVGAPKHFEVLFTMEKTLGSMKDEIAKWLAATVEGQKYYMNNTDQAAEFIVKRSPNLNLDLTQQKAQTAAEAKYVNPPNRDLPLLRIDKQGAALAIKQLADQGKLPGKVTLEELLDESALDAAYTTLR